MMMNELNDEMLSFLSYFPQEFIPRKNKEMSKQTPQWVNETKQQQQQNEMKTRRNIENESTKERSVRNRNRSQLIS